MMAIPTAAVYMIVVIASRVRIVVQFAGKEHRHRAIGIPCDTAEKTNARIRQSGFGTVADAAANHNIHAALGEKRRQRSVAAAVGVGKRNGGDSAVFDRIEAKLLGVTEMTEHKPVFVRNRDNQGDNILSFYIENTIYMIPRLSKSVNHYKNVKKSIYCVQNVLKFSYLVL